MQKDGFPLMLKLLEHKPPRPYTIFFSHGFTTGDCKGNNILAGRYGTFTSKCALISRTCDWLQKADDPHYPCRFLTQQSVEDVCALSNISARNKALQDMSYHFVPNNVFYMLCSAGNIFGIHGCTQLLLLLPRLAFLILVHRRLLSDDNKFHASLESRNPSLSLLWLPLLLGFVFDLPPGLA